MDANELRRPLSVPEILVNALCQTPERPFLHLADGTVLSVGHVRDTTSRFVQALAGLGVGRKSRVATLLSNQPEVLHVTHALQVLGAISVPMHGQGSLEDHVHVALDAPAEFLVFDPLRFSGRAAELRRCAPGLTLLALGEDANAVDLLSLARGYPPTELVAPKVAGSEVMRLGYTGGTTGKPKPLATTHGAALATLQIMLAEWPWPSSLRVLSCGPLSHAAGAMLLPTLLKRGTLLIQPRFDPVAVLEAVEVHRITCMLLVPRMIVGLLDHPRFDEFDLSSLETVFYGASSIAPTRLREAIERIGPVFCQFYGQSEAPMTLSVLHKEEHDVGDLERLASCGRPVPWVRVQLFDPDMNPVEDGEPGEICVQGPVVMDGYRGDPERTAYAFRGGWLHTGDVAIRDSDGFLRIVTHEKNMIIKNGNNIYPEQIEDALGSHPAVRQVAVLGVPDEASGELIKACVVLRPGAELSADELCQLAIAKRGGLHGLDFVEFIEELPLTAVGLLSRKELRTHYGSATGHRPRRPRRPRR
ncbi:MAG: AMP-binding protein [Myxococcales bacterium]|nr:AMP-binding protein [Myxococcales bacterium]